MNKMDRLDIFGYSLTVTTAVSTPVEFVSVSEAAERLGISRNGVKRRLDVGLISGYADPTNGYRYVSVASLDRLQRQLEELQRVASLPGSQAHDGQFSEPLEDD